MELYLKTVKPDASEDIDEIQLASDILDLIENGCPSDCAARKNNNLNEGDELSRAYVTSLAQARQKKEAPILAREIYDKIMAESKAFKDMTPTEFDKEGDFTAALAEKAEYLDPAVKIQKLKDFHDVSTWDDLKALYPTPVVKEVPKIIEEI